MSDDFLARIQKSEEEAQQLIEKALEKKKNELQKEHQRLAETRTKNLEKSRAKAKGKLVEKQKEMRGVYDQLVTEGKKESQALEGEADKKMDKVQSSAFLFFTNELI